MKLNQPFFENIFYRYQSFISIDFIGGYRGFPLWSNRVTLSIFNHDLL